MSLKDLQRQAIKELAELDAPTFLTDGCPGVIGMGGAVDMWRAILTGSQPVESMVIRFYPDPLNSKNILSAFPNAPKETSVMNGESEKNRGLKETWDFGFGPLIVSASNDGREGVWVHLLVAPVEQTSRNGRTWKNKWPIFCIQDLPNKDWVAAAKVSKQWNAICKGDHDHALNAALARHAEWREEVRKRFLVP